MLNPPTTEKVAVRARAAESNGNRHRGRYELFLDFFVPNALYLYVRLWHRCPRFDGLPPFPRGGALVIANHPCHADAAFLMAACRKRVHFLQAREEYEVPFLRPFFRLSGCIPVDRNRPDPGAIRSALECLRGGAVVGLFPEGDLTPPGGAGLRPGHAGAALLALRGGVPVIPAYIAGAPRPRGTVADWVRPARGVRVYFGPPVGLRAFRRGPITHARLREVTDLLMRRIADLRPPPCAAAGSN